MRLAAGHSPILPETSMKMIMVSHISSDTPTTCAKSSSMLCKHKQTSSNVFQKWATAAPFSQAEGWRGGLDLQAALTTPCTCKVNLGACNQAPEAGKGSCSEQELAARAPAFRRQQYDGCRNALQGDSAATAYCCLGAGQLAGPQAMSPTRTPSMAPRLRPGRTF